MARNYTLKDGEKLDGLTSAEIMQATDFSKLTRGQLAHRYEMNLDERARLNDENKALKEVYSSVSKNEKESKNLSKIAALEAQIAALQGSKTQEVAVETPKKAKKAN